MKSGKVDFINVFKILGYFKEERVVELYRSYVERLESELHGDGDFRQVIDRSTKMLE